jgi:hypothetical protein
MFRTSYVHHQEDYIVHEVMFFMHLCKQSSRLEDVHINAWKKCHIRLHVQYCIVFIIVAPCISKIHLSSHTNKCTNIIYYLKSVLILDIKTLYSLIAPTRFNTTRHHQGALVFLARITGKIICKTRVYCALGVAAYHEFLCAATPSTQYTRVLQIILPVILARKTSAP